MAARELVVLGTASQVPTRARNHNGYVLRWDSEVVLFDPGEGTQRQMALADISPSSITAICITHFHGDHCLGLPGVLARLALDQVHHPVDLYFPASGAEHLDHLRHAAVLDRWEGLRLHPVDADGVVGHQGALELSTAHLDHRIDAFGWRFSEPDGRRMDADRLAAAGIEGPDVGRLQRDGVITIDEVTTRLEEVSEHRPGQHFAFVMDTRPCDAAIALAERADLLVCESTFLEDEVDLAVAFGHMTARQAARVASEAGARRLVLTHFSQRYPDEGAFREEALELFDDVIAARDLITVEVPRRALG